MIYLSQREHLSASLRNAGHLSNDGQVMNHEGDLILLAPGKRHSVPKHAETSDTSGGMSFILVH